MLALPFQKENVMLNLKFIQDSPGEVIEKLKKRNFDASEIVGSITDLYRRKNEAQQMAEQAKAEMNVISKEIGQLFREGKRQKQMQQNQDISAERGIKSLDAVC